MSHSMSSKTAQVDGNQHATSLVCPGECGTSPDHWAWNPKSRSGHLGEDGDPAAGLPRILTWDLRWFRWWVIVETTACAGFLEGTEKKPVLIGSRDDTTLQHPSSHQHLRLVRPMSLMITSPLIMASAPGAASKAGDPPLSKSHCSLWRGAWIYLVRHGSLRW